MQIPNFSLNLIWLKMAWTVWGRYETRQIYVLLQLIRKKTFLKINFILLFLTLKYFPSGCHSRLVEWIIERNGQHSRLVVSSFINKFYVGAHFENFECSTYKNVSYWVFELICLISIKLFLPNLFQAVVRKNIFNNPKQIFT